MSNYNQGNNTNNLELASLGARAKAFVIDDILITVIILIIFWDSVASSGNDIASVLMVMNEFVMQVLMLKFVYQTFFVWYYGATVGKIIAKIRVVDYDNFNRVNLLQSALRSFARILGEMFFYIGFVFAYFNDGKQTFHDKISKTLVINA